MQEKYLVRSTLEVLAIRIIAGKLPEEIERKWMSVWSRWKKLRKKKMCTTLCVMMNSFIHALFEQRKCETLYKIWAMLRESNLCGYYTMGVESIIPFDVLRYNHEILLKGIKRIAC